MFPLVERSARRVRGWAFLLVVLCTVSGVMAGTDGLHLERKQQLNFNQVLTDGAGYRWDIQNYGTIGSGTNAAYGGGMYCQIWGSNVYATNGFGWRGDDPNEIEIGPYNRNNIQAYRRIKVYQDIGLARWLDIFTNTTGADIQMTVTLYSYFNNGIGSITTSSGGATFGEKDWAMMTQSRNNTAVPGILHILCDKRSDLRPSIQTNVNQLYVRYNITVPANGTAVLCYFQSQNSDPAKHKTMMKKFRPYRMLKDLPSSVRKLILNFSGGSAFGDLELERDETGDQVLMENDDPIRGTIRNRSFSMETFFGDIELPAENVIGMGLMPGDRNRIRVLLTDGQIISGKTPAEPLEIALSTGSVLRIPLNRIKQWSFRISKDRPADIPFRGPLLRMRGGDQLAFAADSCKMTMRTLHGQVDLKGADLLRIDMDNAGHGLHRVFFRNGTALGGFILEDRLSLKLALGKAIAVDRAEAIQIVYGQEVGDVTGYAVAEMNNDDELYGMLADTAILMASEFSGTEPVKLAPESIQQIEFSENQFGECKIVLYDDSVLRGRLTQPKLKFQITANTVLHVAPGQFRVIRQKALPPLDIRQKVAKLVPQLGAESFVDREKATTELKSIGKPAIPMLKRYLSTNDPEIRQRIKAIIRELGGKVEENADAEHAVPPAGWNGRPGGPVLLRAARMPRPAPNICFEVPD
ncbi:MAG: hypothetical protein ACLFVU_12235 [Phycisphaerae bacterium]